MQLRLASILDFFAVARQTVQVTEMANAWVEAREHVVFGSLPCISGAFEQEKPLEHDLLQNAAAVYAYPTESLSKNTPALRFLSGNADIDLHEAPAVDLAIRISDELADVAGPMAGLKLSLRLRRGDFVVGDAASRTDGRASTIISAGGAPIFHRFEYSGVPVFLCASSNMVDIDQPVGPGFYDVKSHFASAIPLVMFLRHMFQDEVWHAQESGACLIIDDPLLRLRYGYCDFQRLRDLMLQHAFTTNIAFIPWNWRRTSADAAAFFARESAYFSVSIHGCDHIKDEFGTTSSKILDGRASLAQSRMRSHESRTGIHHDPVMVFPQGVFSSVCPEVLKRNGFLAAVNTEIVPVDDEGARPCVRDLWDVAIKTYEGFPIFTRRYASHGLENFAFDLLLGKPCLIVSHHDFFKDGGGELVELIEKLRSLNCTLQWRPLGEVIRRACRRRAAAGEVEDVEMYGKELYIHNRFSREKELRVRKRESHSDLVVEILSDGKPVTWSAEGDQIVFGHRMQPNSEIRFEVVYRPSTDLGTADRSVRFELSVAARRLLCEFRDGYLSESRLLNSAAANLRKVATRTN